MKNQIRLKKEFVEEILFTFGTAKKFADISGLSPATVSGILKGKSAGIKARKLFVSTINENTHRDPLLTQKDMFEVQRACDMESVY